jgi:D-alanyl-D-alanine carboxypeptidase
MSPPAPRRPTSAHVYRFRRAAAASALVVVVGLGWNLLAGDSSDGPQRTAAAVATTTPAPPPELPPCVDGDTITTQDPDHDWATILVDTAVALPAGYGPPDLHNISEAGFPFAEGVMLRSLVMDDLSALREAATANGTPLGVLDGYRSYPRQVELYEQRSGDTGSYEAGSRVVRPGHSDHQLGTALDVTTEGATDVDASWSSSSTGQWLASNAHEFGFIITYPTDASERTCFQPEPWHVRYVGREHAAAIIKSRVTAREYFWALSIGVAPAG